MLRVTFQDSEGNTRHGIYDNFSGLNEVIARTGWKVIRID